MGRKHLKLEEKNSRLALQIEEYFRTARKEPLTFGQILNKYAIKGESCDTVAERMRDMTKGTVKILHSTFGYAVRLVIKQNKTKYRIEAMEPGNKFRKPGSGRHVHSPQGAENRRRAIRLRLDGWKVADIARELGISTQRVSQILIDHKKSLGEP